MKIKSAAVTDVGRVRQNNEDNFYLCGQYRADTALCCTSCSCEGSRSDWLMGVCDGMGGEAYGELASLIAVRLLDSYAPGFREKVEQWVEQANGEICREIKARGVRRMGTTFAALELTEGFAYAFNIGDSRIYHIRGGKIQQLSEDHTQLQLMINQGLVSQEAAKSHPAGHILTQHLGIFPEEMLLEAHAAEPAAVQNGDVFLLCSDGLTDALSDSDILKSISTGISTEQRANDLVRAALRAGSRDNVTVVLAEVIDAESPAPKKPRIDCDAASQLLTRLSKRGNTELVEELMSMIKARADAQNAEE